MNVCDSVYSKSVESVSVYTAKYISRHKFRLA
jgi:hypothetical protein